MQIKPVGWYVLVEIEEYEEVTASGIIIPDQVKEREDNSHDIGTIVAMGPLAFSERGGKENWADVGDKVLFARHGGKKKGGQRLINDEDVFAKIED